MITYAGISTIGVWWNPSGQFDGEDFPSQTPISGAQFVPYVPQNVIRQTWDVVTPLPQPLYIFVPIPAQGQQPPPYSTAVLNEIRRLWEPPDPQPQRLPPFVPIPTVVQNPPYSTAILNEIRRLWEPPDPQPRQIPPPYVPIPAQGQQVPAPSQYPQALFQWQLPFQLPQTLPGTAAWNVPIVSFVPSVRFPQHVIDSWRPTWQQPQVLTSIAPLTLKYGQQPPPWMKYDGATILKAWEKPWVFVSLPIPFPQAGIALLGGPLLIEAGQIGYLIAQAGQSFSIISAGQLGYYMVQAGQSVDVLWAGQAGYDVAKAGQME